MKKFLIYAALASIGVSSAFAQTAAVGSEYYVVQDVTTKKCTVVDRKPPITKPTTTTSTIVDNGTFKTRIEAESGMKTMKVCTVN